MSVQKDEYDLLLKVLMIGDSNVGKTCILHRFVDEVFSKDFVPTCGIDFRIKTLMFHGKKLRLQLWDTAGSERFNSITGAYYRGAHAILIVYDVGNMDSFHHVTKWIADIEANTSPDHPPPKVVLVGNKCDIPVAERCVDAPLASKIAADYGMKFIEASAKTNVNVEEAILLALEQVLSDKRFSYLNRSPNGSTSLVDGIVAKSKCC